MSIVENGVPLQVGGAWVGAEDFRTQVVGAGQPTGVTIYAGAPGNTMVLEEIADAGGEIGKFIDADNVGGGGGQGTRIVWGIDAFDGLVGDDVEMVTLCRVGRFSNSGFSNRKCPGPAFNVSGQGALFTANAFPATATAGGASVPVSSRWNAIINDAAGFVPGGLDISVGAQDFTNEVWLWQRVRRNIDPGDATQYQVKRKIWAGTFASEPAAWGEEFVVDIALSNSPNALGAIGAGSMPISWDGPEWGIAFVSFTTDPLNEAPPTPSEVVNVGGLGPVVAITEIQGTWATGEIDGVVPPPVPTGADFRSLTFADTPWAWVDGDFQVFANPAGGILRIDLPDAAAYLASGNFNPIHIKNTGAPTLDINTEYVQVFGVNGNLIDGFTDVINRLQQTNHTFITDGINWYLQ